MVAILATTLAVLFATSVSANPTPDAMFNGLVIRQTNGTATNGTSPIGGLPNVDQCTSNCSAILTLSQSCSDASCFCKQDVVTNYGTCLDCLVAYTAGGFDTKTAQTSVDQIVSLCKAAGTPLNSFTITAKGNGAIRTGAFTTGAMSVAVIGAILAFA